MTARPLPTVLVTAGPAITWTNYWASARALAGYPCLAYVAGALQILVPPFGEHVLEQLPAVGSRVEIWEDLGEGCAVYRLLWFDAELRVQHELLVEEENWFGYYPRIDVGRTVPLVWYTQIGEGNVLERRREQILLGRAS